MHDPDCDVSSGTEGLGWRVTLSIITGVAWLSFIILWLAFFAVDYSAYRNLAIILVSTTAIGAVLGIPWTMYGMKHKTAKEKMQNEFPGFKLRVRMSMITFFVMFAVLVFWLWSYADDYSIWQNIAVFIVLLLIFGGAMAASWASWGIKYGKQMEEQEKKIESTEIKKD